MCIKNLLLNPKVKSMEIFDWFLACGEGEIYDYPVKGCICVGGKSKKNWMLKWLKKLVRELSCEGWN